jgi:hypothetical protein
MQHCSAVQEVSLILNMTARLGLIQTFLAMFIYSTESSGGGNPAFVWA